MLDDLPRDRKIVFSCVMSKTLQGMLERYGFEKKIEYDPEFEEDYEAFVREAENLAGGKAVL